MRTSSVAGLLLSVSVAAAVGLCAHAATTPQPATPSTTACPGNPNALGVSRTVEIDTTGGPAFGFQQFKAYDFLRDHEVVLTFDDGPWPHNTPEVLKALADQCVKATFFSIGEHALWHPELLKEVAAQGHTIGAHTWSHANLEKKTFDEAKDEIERGFSAVRAALGAPPAPFFRFPALVRPPEVLKYLGQRNIAIFSTDIDSFDFKWRKRGLLVPHVMAKLAKTGKGIILMHDFQRATADDIASLLVALKSKGYRVVHMRAKEQAKTLASYDAAIDKQFADTVVGARPLAGVVRTIQGN